MEWKIYQGFIWKYGKENGMEILLTKEVGMQWSFYLLKMSRNIMANVKGNEVNVY